MPIVFDSPQSGLLIEQIRGNVTQVDIVESFDTCLEHLNQAEVQTHLVVSLQDATVPFGANYMSYLREMLASPMLGHIVMHGNSQSQMLDRFVSTYAKIYSRVKVCHTNEELIEFLLGLNLDLTQVSVSMLMRFGHESNHNTA
jgi:hypothetical protein